MLNKNKKIIIILVAAFVVVLVVALVSNKILKRVQDDTSQLGEVKKAANLDEYIKNDPELAQGKELEDSGISRMEITPPVPTQIPIDKITMTPVGLGGGDPVYAPVVELPGNKFFKLEQNNSDKVFSVTNPEEALKYIDFIMVSAGQSNYDRIKQTVWRSSDYDKIGCKDVANNQNLALPTDRPVSLAKVSGTGFEVTWVYFTPTVPAGYHKMVLQVEKDGGFTIKNNPDQAFWPCGQGFVF